MTANSCKYQVLCVVGARPNFMKIAPIMRTFSTSETLEAKLLHTGQHYDEAMKASFFLQLGIPEPDIDLGVGSGSHAVQTAEIMRRFEPVLDQLCPDAVLVVGDVNSTIACALVAVKKHIPVFHVEAGLRSGDRAMPEEINRILTDQLSDLLFTTEQSAEANLTREGIEADKVHFVGNVMIDTLRYNLSRAQSAPTTLSSYMPADQADQPYGLMTLHRPSNVDDAQVLGGLISVLGELSVQLPLVFPVHPRTLQRIQEAGLEPILKAARITLLPPQGYLQMLGLMQSAAVVLTDSGGIQEETTALGTPCITLRENTERPITVEQGTNTVVGKDAQLIKQAFMQVMDNGGKSGRIPELWDGMAAERIVTTIGRWFAERTPSAS